MEIERLINELEEIIENSWHLPLSGGRAVVNSNEIKNILENLRLNLPKEVLQAKNIVAERTKIIDDAKRESEAIMKISEEKIRNLVNKNEIVKNAQIIANKVLADAKEKAKQMRTSSCEYVEELMKNVDQALTSNLTEIRKVRQNLRHSEHKFD